MIEPSKNSTLKTYMTSQILIVMLVSHEMRYLEVPLLKDVSLYPEACVQSLSWCLHTKTRL